MDKPEEFDVDMLTDRYIHKRHAIQKEHVYAFRVGARYACHANANLIHWYERRIKRLEAALEVGDLRVYGGK